VRSALSRTGIGAVAAVVAWVLGGGGRAALSSPAPPPAAHVFGPPAAHTGGFGEPTCHECHAEFDVNALGGRVELEGLPAAYEPGRSYAVVVSLHSSEMAAAGFQMSARFDDGRPAGTLVAAESRVTVVDSAGVPYAQHAPQGTRPGTPEVARWAVEWVAPATGGRVRFHVAANSANGDNSPFGDLVYTAEKAVAVR